MSENNIIRSSLTRPYSDQMVSGVLNVVVVNPTNLNDFERLIKVLTNLCDEHGYDIVMYSDMVTVKHGGSDYPEHLMVNWCINHNTHRARKKGSFDIIFADEDVESYWNGSIQEQYCLEKGITIPFARGG